jgi:hypothetical protein
MAGIIAELERLLDALERLAVKVKDMMVWAGGELFRILRYLLRLLETVAEKIRGIIESLRGGGV